MTKKVALVRNIIIVLLFLEIIVFYGLYGIFSMINMLPFSLYVTIRNGILIALLFYLGYVLNSNAVSVAEALNEDSNNALIFGGVGIIQYDESRNITWISDLLSAMGLKIIGLKLLDWQPTLAGLFESDDIRIIDVKGKKFECYNSEETRMIFLKDITQYYSLEQDYDDGQICMAYITIDNFDETLENADESKAAQIQSTSRKVIVDWAYENGMIIRRFKSGGYMAFFNERIYKKLVEDKFSILDEFKKKSMELDEVITLSIGIGRGTRVLRELEENATAALRLTYSRGGDQVVIKSGKDNIRFFGGTTDTYEKSSKVRARVIATSLSGVIKRSSNVFVMGHKFSDLDSLGGSLAMARLVEAYDKKVKIVIDFNSLEEKTRYVAMKMREDDRYEDLLCSYNEALEMVNKDSLLVLVDHHKSSLSIASGLLDVVKNKVVIDHHRRGEDFIEMPILTYLEPSASSTVELIVELCGYQNVDVKFNEMDATIMYAGMLVDTNYFKQRVGVRTFQSAARLKELNANVVQAYELLEDSFEKTKEILDITKTAVRYRDHILIAHGEENEEHQSSAFAKASNQLLSVQDVLATFTVGRLNKNTVAISGRSSRDINVQMIMEKLGGGGHFTMAACQITDKSIDEVIEMLHNAIDAYFNERGDV